MDGGVYNKRGLEDSFYWKNCTGDGRKSGDRS